MSRVTAPRRPDEVLEAGRVLGRSLHPDTAAALQTVGLIAASRRARRRVRRNVGVVLAASGVLVVGAALFGRSVPPVRSDTASATPVSAPAEVAEPGLVQPAVALVRARVASPIIPVAGATGPAPVALQSCDRAHLSLELALAQDTYAPGQATVAALVLRNTGAATCGVPVDPCRSGITVSAPDGSTVYASGADGTWRCATAASLLAVAPGGIARLTYTWTGADCVALQGLCGSPNGRYRVDGAWAMGPEAPLSPLPRHLAYSTGQRS